MHPLLQRVAALPAARPVYRQLRQRRLARTIARYPSRDVRHSYAGFELNVALRDPLAEGWYDHDWSAQAELDLLSSRGRLGEGATVIDIGAHQGVVGLLCAARVGGGKVIAVEAEPHNVRVARLNAQMNPGLRLDVVHAAIDARPGTLWFSEGLNGTVLPGGHAGKVEVPAVTVDELAMRHGHPDVILVDVEGFEGRALEGATAVLNAGTTDFFVEVHDAETIGRNGWCGRDIVARLEEAGGEILVAPAYDGPIESQFRAVVRASVDWDKRFYCVALFG